MLLQPSAFRMHTNADIFCLTCYYVLLLHSKIFLDVNIRKKIYTRLYIWINIYKRYTKTHFLFSVICLGLLLLTFCKPHQNKTLPSSGQNAGLFKVKLSSMLIVTDNNLVFFFFSVLLGYHGLYCEEEYNECLSAPCQNYATCRDLINAYECICAPQFTGAFSSLAGPHLHFMYI